MWETAVLKKLNYDVGAESGKREVTATGDGLLVRPPEGWLWDTSAVNICVKDLGG